MSKKEQAMHSAEQLARKIITENLGQSADEAAVKKVARRLYNTVPRQSLAA